MIPEMAKVLIHFHKNRGLEDFEYAAATLIKWWGLSQMLDSQKWKDDNDAITLTKENVFDLLEFTGFGVCKEFHWDIAYFYAIYTDGVIETYVCPYSSVKTDDLKKVGTLNIGDLEFGDPKEIGRVIENESY